MCKHLCQQVVNFKNNRYGYANQTGQYQSIRLGGYGHQKPGITTNEKEYTSAVMKKDWIG
jgi:hypothetical protein